MYDAVVWMDWCHCNRRRNDNRSHLMSRLTRTRTRAGTIGGVRLTFVKGVMSLAVVAE